MEYEKISRKEYPNTYCCWEQTPKIVDWKMIVLLERLRSVGAMLVLGRVDVMSCSILQSLENSRAENSDVF